MEEIVIVASKRTAICKAKRGHFKETTTDKLLYSVITGCLGSTNIEADMVEECAFGNVLAKMGGTVEARAAVLAAGVPVSVPVITLNRQCASGLEAISYIADQIRNKKISIGLAGGFESMSHNPMDANINLDPEIMKNKESKDCLMKMGDTSELVAEKYSIKRTDADYFACESQLKALAATKLGLFDDEIVPVTVNNKEIREDEGIRETSFDALSKLRPAFKSDGVSTAGNSSQMSDAAAAVILTTRKKAIELGLVIQAVFCDYVVTGCDPSLMGIGPTYAVPMLLSKNDLKMDDIDVFEINEAFASQAVYCVDKLGIDEKKVNLFGGAIALGHPLGCTGTRLVVTLINIMKKKDLKCGIISLCVGTGMGVAALIKKD